MKKLLIETMPVAFQILEEASQKNAGRMTVKGIFAAADEINSNGRVYPEKIQDREIDKLKPLIEDRRIFSEADHPDDGRSRIRNTAAMPISIEKKVVDDRKVYFGEAIILNTEQGKNIQEIIRAGGKVGVSQRGWGSLSLGNWQGKQADIVQEDYTLKTFDFVIGQSTKGAEVAEFAEQMDINILSAPEEGAQQTTKGGQIAMEVKTLEELRKAYPELCLQIETEAMAKREKELKEVMQKEWEAQLKEVAEGIKKQIEESEEYKEFKKGMDLHKATLIEIGKLVKPYVVEGKGDGDEGIEEQLAALRTEIEAVKGENKTLKEQTEREKKETESKKEVAKRIQEVTAGKEHEKLLVERLQDCKTVDEVNTRAATEETFIKKVLVEQKPEGQPKGDGKVLTEGEKEKLDASKERDRKVAGLA